MQAEHLDREIKVEQAGPALAAAIRMLIAGQMASALIEARCDLSDQQAIRRALLGRGFTNRTIDPLWFAASNLAAEPLGQESIAI